MSRLIEKSVQSIPAEATRDGFLITQVKGYYMRIQDWWILIYANEA